jgi:hypothetical protein
VSAYALEIARCVHDLALVCGFAHPPKSITERPRNTGELLGVFRKCMSV